MAEQPLINNNQITYSDESPTPSECNVDLPLFANLFSILCSPFHHPSSLLISMDYEDMTSQDNYRNDYNFHPNNEQDSSVEDLTPPIIPKRYIKCFWLHSNIYDYFEKINEKGECVESKGNFKYNYKF
ncbi:hypothetical protein O181_004328 [Austropuccinia psidii MF-1]|uniref:Uncharacterized protein n=1 Tax=Austropuccinia psidii MF-1 TaxID=1389203 RepID=A0A9Q3BG49_9BASI|nr:hypothetical protein [Austropuccinia psidii MF-1]